MAKFFPELTAEHRDFIAGQNIFFVASAPSSGRVNVSPKGMNTFRAFDSRCAYLDSTGSGNETAAHLADNGRITIMFCALSVRPLILRLYGHGRAIRPRDSEWPQFRPRFGPPLTGERQLIVIDIESVQTSCGFGVPLFEFAGERSQLTEWATKKGPDGLAAYWASNNQCSIDGLPTGLLEQ